MFWRYCSFEMYFRVISVLGPLRNIKELNNGREIMVIKYAEDLQALYSTGLECKMILTNWINGLEKCDAV